MLDTYQLQVFLAVVETGSYTGAAQRLHLTQPAVSRQVRLLQERLGVRLLRRSGRRMLPTHAGEHLAEVARQVLAMTRQLEQDMALLRGEAAGVLRIGGSGAPAWYALGRLLPAFRAEYPRVEFRLEGWPVEGAGRALREGRLDLLIGEEEVRERGLTCDVLLGMETALVAPADEHWVQRKRLALRKLATLPLILPAAGTPSRRFLEDFLEERGLHLPNTLPALEVVDPGAALPLVANGLGVALLPRSILERVTAPVHLITLWPGFSWPLYLTRRAGPAGRLEELFCTFALERGKNLLR
ncbi:MAG: LysR family transcriptional regulator [Chloroflexia bacterium]